MENYPHPYNERSEYLPNEFQSESFGYAYIVARQVLAKPGLTCEQRLAVRSEQIYELNRAFGEEFQSQLANFIAYAHIADVDGELTGEAEMIAYTDALYEGITIVPINGEDKVVFGFFGERPHSDGVSQVVYFVEPDGFLKLDIVIDDDQFESEDEDFS